MKLKVKLPLEVWSSITSQMNIELQVQMFHCNLLQTFECIILPLVGLCNISLSITFLLILEHPSAST